MAIHKNVQHIYFKKTFQNLTHSKKCMPKEVPGFPQHNQIQIIKVIEVGSHLAFIA